MPGLLTKKWECKQIVWVTGRRGPSNMKISLWLTYSTYRNTAGKKKQRLSITQQQQPSTTQVLCYRCTVHFEIHAVHTHTNKRTFINLVKSFKFTLTLILLTWRIWWASNNASSWQMGFNWAFKGLKYTIISFLHVSVFNDHHQGALSVPGWSYIYVKTLGKITSLYKLGDVTVCCRAACVLCAVQSESSGMCVVCSAEWV